MAMGDPGQLRLPDLADWLSTRSPRQAERPSPPWQLGETVIVMANFEVPRAKASVALPESLTQPLNAYGRVLVLSCADSPVGPFAWAQLIVAGRYSNAMPRDWIVDWIVEGDGLLAGSGDYRYPVRAGHVSLKFDGATAEAQVADASGQTIVAIEARTSVTLDPAMIRYDDFAYPVQSEGEIGVQESRIVADVLDAWTDRAFTMRLGETEVFDILPPTHMITSTLADCASVTLNAPKEWRT